MNIYVGNLSHDVTEDDLRQAFEAFGQVESVHIIKDRFSGQSRGFGFVEMPSKEEAQTAVKEMDSHDLKGRTIRVNEAYDRASRGSGSSSGGGAGRRGGSGDRRGGFGRGRGGSGGGAGGHRY